MPSRRDFLAGAAILWEQAVARAQADINAAQQQIRREQHLHGIKAELKQPAYRYGFLSVPEQALLRRLAARIVPADERSGGAAAARCEEYIDFILGHAASELQQSWRAGLQRAARALPKRTPAAIDTWLTNISANEFRPETPDEHFFVMLKGGVTEAFYTSAEGIEKELGYQGLAFLRAFPGCDHTEHKAPADFQPRLQERS